MSHLFDTMRASCMSPAQWALCIAGAWLILGYIAIGVGYLIAFCRRGNPQR